MESKTGNRSSLLPPAHFEPSHGSFTRNKKKKTTLALLSVAHLGVTRSPDRELKPGKCRLVMRLMFSSGDI